VNPGSASDDRVSRSVRNTAERSHPRPGWHSVVISDAGGVRNGS
jgi:hypothetical protein